MTAPRVLSTSIRVAVLLAASLGMPPSAAAADPPKPTAVVTVDTDAPAPKYSRMIFGGFLEHFDRQVYGGVFDPGSPLSDKKGFRKDVVAALKELGTPVVRWPGGCFVSGYNWEQGVGNLRKPVDDMAWGGREPNTFGTDEYVELCRLLDWTPYICTNAGNGTVEEMRNWVEYCNGATGKYARMRQASGHAKPHDVALWSIGNENYHGSEIGHKPIEQWAPFVAKSAKAMKAADPNVRLTAAALATREWTLPLLKAAGAHLDYISIHDYWLPLWEKNETPDYLTCVMKSEEPERTLTRFIGVLDESGHRGRIKIAYDEWNLRSWHHPGFPRTSVQNYTDPEVVRLVKAREKNETASQYTMADALFSASFFNACLRHSEDVGMANIAPLVNTRGPLAVHPKGVVKRTHFHAMAMYANELGPRVGKLALVADKLERDKQSVPVADAIATVDHTGRHWAIALVNRHPDRPLACTVRLKDFALEGEYDAVVLSGESPDSFNDVEHPSRVAPEKKKLSFHDGVVELPPHSLTILKVSPAARPGGGGATAPTGGKGVVQKAIVKEETFPLSAVKLLEKETFWDNKDWDWYAARVPFFECPDADVQTTYYYRWELLTKHLTYGSPDSGYSFTEFIDRPFWSGAYGTISCAAGHQLYEARWLRDPQIARDYARYWLRTPGAQPRNYSTWLADSVWAVHQVHPDDRFVTDLLPDLKKNHEGWEKRHFVKDVGLFWQTGHDDGMEFNINSRQTKDILRGAPGYRPTFNAYMWADALAIARTAELAGDSDAAKAYRGKAAGLSEKLHAKLWDPKRQFFFPMFKQDEEADGHKTKALTLTYQSGKHAGSAYGRELIGYVPWQFSMIEKGKGHEAAWAKLVDKNAFAAAFGPRTVERNDPMYLLKDSCCWWSGQSWPYATSQTLKAMANLLQGYDQKVVTPADYVKLLQTFAKTHRKNGKPYLAEGCHPDTGSWDGHDGYNHSEHYFHSSFNDLVITGLAGLRPRDDDTLEVVPLAPAAWGYFALDRVPYKGQLVSILWDRDGTRYQKGKGLRLFADGKEIAASEKLGPLTAKLPAAKQEPEPAGAVVNFAVNNDGTYYPRVTASYSNPRTPLAKVNDGNYWYHLDPPNRWTCQGSPNAADSVEVDFGTARPVRTVKLYFLDDGKDVVPPESFALEAWDGKEWKSIPDQTRVPERPTGRRANVVSFPAVIAGKVRAVGKVRVVFTHANGGKTGLTEIEAWGDATRPLPAPPHPAGNIAYNPGDRPFPKAIASHSDRFGGKAMLAIDGKTNFLPSPTNRWTSYESPDTTDWLEVDFGKEMTFRRVELAIYDDGGGVQPPTKYEVEYWDGSGWKGVANAKSVPEKPTGGRFNEVRFDAATASKVRVVFTHAGKARSGVSEVFVWKE